MGGALHHRRLGSARVREDGPEPHSRWYREARAFARLPGIVLVSLIAPAVVEQGLAGLLAALVTLAIALRTRGLLPAMAGGVATAALLRLI